MGASGNAPSDMPVGAGGRGVRLCSSVPRPRRSSSDHASTVGFGGQRGEVDIDTAATPATGERHHPNRIETLADEVAIGVDGIGADAEQFGDLSAHVASGLPATEAPIHISQQTQTLLLVSGG